MTAREASSHGDASHRGSTEIADRVVERIVTQAAAETGDTGGARRTVLGMGVGRGRSARTDVSVNGRLVIARVEMSVAYPAPVREVAHRVREHVRDRVQELTGLTVHQVDVDVAALEHSVPAPAKSGAMQVRGPRLPARASREAMS